MDDRLVDDVTKIAVLRANAIGDFVFTLPALEALRAAYPGAEIVLLGRAWHRAFLRGRPGPIDRVVVTPTMSDDLDPLASWQDAPGVDGFFEEMRRERFDLALQMHGGGGNSNPFVRRLSARVTAGACAEGAEPLDRSVPYVRFHSEVLRYLEVAGLVGAPPVTLEPRLRVTGADRRQAREAVPPSGRPLVVLNPGARDPRRRWPAERFAAVGDALAAAGADIVLNVSERERELAATVLSWMRREVRAVVPSLSLSALVGLLERAALVVSNDTGPLHLGMAVGCPAVGVFWCGNALTSGPLRCADRAWHLSWRMDCPTCGRDCMHQGCEHDDSFVADISTEDVLGSALALLEAGAHRATEGAVPEVSCQGAKPPRKTTIEPSAEPPTPWRLGALARGFEATARADRPAPRAAPERSSPRDRPAPRAAPARSSPQPTANGQRSTERIAVVRALQLGDMLCAVPALRALRKAHPDAHITLVGLPWHERLQPRFSRYIDEVAVLPGWPGLPEQPCRPQEIPRFLERMHEQRYDLALQLHGAGTVTNPLTLALGAQRAGGFFRPGDVCPDEAAFLPWEEQEHEVLRWLRLLERLDVPPDGAALEMPILAEEDDEAEAFRERAGLSKGGYVCLHAGARVRDKCWPPEAFAEVADGLAASGLEIVLTGSAAETDLTTAVARAMRATPIDSAAADLSLGGMAALIRDGRALVCNDTGVSHMAAALGVPSAVVFTQTDPARWAPLDRDRHRPLVSPAPAEVLAEARALLR